MAFRKKNRKTPRSFKKRTRVAGKRKPKVTRNLNMVTLGEGFPKMIKIAHKYHQYMNLISTGGVLAYNRFSCNSLFKPDQTGAGTQQPMFFDQMALLYQHYHVVGSKINVTFLPSAAGSNPLVCGIYVDDDTTALSSDYGLLIEQSNSNYLTTSFNNSTGRHLSHKWSAKKFFGKGLLSNTDLEGTPIASPIEQSFFYVYQQPVDQTSTVGCWIEVTIEYIAIWNEIKTVARS